MYLTAGEVDRPRRLALHRKAVYVEIGINSSRGQMSMFLGYNTNGFAHHRLEDAIEVLAGLGYRGIALTLDHHALNPFESAFKDQLVRIKTLLCRYELRVVIETGARFILDRWRKHSPTLMDDPDSGQQHRLRFLHAAIKIAAELRADAVSFWSGALVDPLDETAALFRLVGGCERLCEAAMKHDVRLAFEPEPGMWVDSMARYGLLWERLKSWPCFGLTIDVGHLQCMGELPISRYLHTWKDRLWNIHIEDMRTGQHDHLQFGEGEIDFPDVFAGLSASGYSGGVYVELSRHSHNAVEVARSSHKYLRRFLGPA